MDINTYLNRIQYSGPVNPDAQTLCGLHHAHMLNVPFENLDIGLKRPILLDDQALWNKIVLQGRGGFCYELNGMFARLLEAIGFDVTYLNARVFNREGQLGIDFDHLALLVQMADRPERWLADVGFGDSFTQPLCFDGPDIQEQGIRAYRLEPGNGGYSTWQKNYAGSWERKYFFDLQPRSYPLDYHTACLYHQTSPESSFTRQSVISRATPEGRVSLEEGWLILTKNGKRTERSINNLSDYNALLKQYFGITL